MAENRQPMRPLAFLLILLSAQTSWAEVPEKKFCAPAVGKEEEEFEFYRAKITEENIIDNKGRILKVFAGPGVVLKEEQYGYSAMREETDTNRFIAEKVRPEIEAGDERLLFADKQNSWGEPNKKMSESQNAIAHYLKALVEIETEKLRRMK